MIVVMRQGVDLRSIEKVEIRLQELGFQTHPIYGATRTVIGAIGDKRGLDFASITMLEGVDSVVPIMKPYKLVSREVSQETSIVDVGGVKFGGKELVMVAGPCAIENRENLFSAARSVRRSGAKVLRGGAFKPRTSPYSFQGLEEEGLKLLREAGDEFGLKLVTEAIDTRDVELISRYSDILQIGARNMQNFRLLKEVGASGKPVFLKRGISATIEEWLMAAEYIAAEGNLNIILCERGIRTFETTIRNTIDLSSIAVVKELSHLPVIVDPSHAAGTWKYVASMSKGALAAGADGLMIEVHTDPANALCDGPQSLKPENFAALAEDLKRVAQAVDRVYPEW